MSKKRTINKLFKIDKVNYKDNYLKLTLEQVATNLGVSLSSIHRWIKSYSSNNGDHDNAFRGSGNYLSNDKEFCYGDIKGNLHNLMKLIREVRKYGGNNG